MSAIGRTWDLFAHRDRGKLWHIGGGGYVKVHMLDLPIVAVLAEEILDEPVGPDVTHYGWEQAGRSSDKHPSMIQIRATSHHPMALLDMCFPGGIEAEVKAGRGRVIALRVTETPRSKRIHGSDAAGAGELPPIPVGEALGPCPSCNAELCAVEAVNPNTGRPTRALVHPIPFCTYFGETTSEVIEQDILRAKPS